MVLFEVLMKAGSLAAQGMMRRGVRTETPVADGDSGGPVFTEEFGQAYICNNMSAGRSMTSKTACDGDNIYKYVVGWPAYKIVNNNSYNIG